MTDKEARERADALLNEMIRIEDDLPNVSDEVLTGMLAAFLANGLQEAYSQGFDDGTYNARCEQLFEAIEEARADE